MADILNTEKYLPPYTEIKLDLERGPPLVDGDKKYRHPPGMYNYVTASITNIFDEHLWVLYNIWVFVIYEWQKNINIYFSLFKSKIYGGWIGKTV